MISSAPGDPIWLREGVFVIKQIGNENGIPVGTFLTSPHRGIYLDRKMYLSKSYIKAYVENIGERLIEEEEVLELNNGTTHVG